MRALAVVAVLLAPAVARADTLEPTAERPFRFSIGGGGSLLLTGKGDGTRNRADGHMSISPGGGFGRYGVTMALRHVVYDPVLEDGLATVGLLYEAAAARPRMVLSLHADVVATIADYDPVVGGGIETHFWIWPKRLGPLALVLDTTAHLVIDGAEDTRLVLAGATRLAIAF